LFVQRVKEKTRVMFWQDQVYNYDHMIGVHSSCTARMTNVGHPNVNIVVFGLVNLGQGSIKTNA